MRKDLCAENYSHLRLAWAEILTKIAWFFFTFFRNKVWNPPFSKKYFVKKFKNIFFIQMTVRNEDDEMEVSVFNGSEVPPIETQNRVIKTHMNSTLHEGDVWRLIPFKWFEVFIISRVSKRFFWKFWNWWPNPNHIPFKVRVSKVIKTSKVENFALKYEF